MPSSSTLPNVMCPGCAHYEFKKSSKRHYCNNSLPFTVPLKCGQNPDKEGTSGNTCKKFEPR
ncbi:MAG: hypothetical protein SPE30_03485 [Candidatus Treponema excrementipullorum]|nr:hypothetical protein [Candidatus Treponema excrementipullorum]MDY4465336.1 hypothetical protein [Candidatus Treponema excrementipullorum]MDY4707374.1 hypothetical protein [Candidatus Treponema excrementipullorum]